MQNINDLSYADFVGFVGQENSPPGGLETVKKWARLASISERACVLDLACSTGYSSRELWRLHKCRGVGVDLSLLAIKSAKRKAEEIGANDLIYLQANAEVLPFEKNTFSHVIAGSCFGFFYSPSAIVEECLRVLKPSGMLCVANFYYKEDAPLQIMHAVERHVGIPLTRAWTKEFWAELYSTRMKLLHRSHESLKVNSEKEVAQQCAISIHNAQLLNPKMRSQALGRLFATRLLLNEHHRYQAYTIEVWVKAR